MHNLFGECGETNCGKGREWKGDNWEYGEMIVCVRVGHIQAECEWPFIMLEFHNHLPP